MDILDKLKELNIEYDIEEHNPIFTIEDANKLNLKIDGIGTKNLFLKDKYDNYYIYVIEENKKADFKFLKEKMGKQLKFGTAEELYDVLKLLPGCVSPLSIINDNGRVKVILDKELAGEKLLFNPNRNTATISIEYENLIKLIKQYKNEYIII